MNYILIGTLDKGGAERQVSYISRLDEVNSVISFSSSNFYNIEKHEPLLTSLKLNKLLLLFLAPIKLALKLKESDTVVSFMEFCNFLNIITSVLTGHKTIVSVRTNPEYYLTKRFGFIYIFLIRFLYQYSHSIVCNNSECRNILIKLGLDASRIKVIENGIDIDSIQKSATTESKSKHLIFCGRLDAVKNLFGLFKVFKEVHNIDPEYVLTIIGDGPERTKLENFVHSNNLSKNVVFVGKQENPFKYFYKGSSLLLTSFFEGSPNVLIEAMACGLPVIAGDCKTGPRELILDKNIEFGILLNIPESQKDYIKWSSEILRMIDDKYERFCSLSLKRSQSFSRSMILEKWRSLLYE